jgi:excisionase family DNA binding protein
MDRENSETLSVPQAAETLGIGMTLAWQLVRNGELPSIRLGGRVLISRAVINRILEGEKFDSSGRAA